MAFCNGIYIIAETDGIPSVPTYTKCRNSAFFVYCDNTYCKYCIPKPINGICNNPIKVDGTDVKCTNIRDVVNKHCESCRRYE